MIQDKQNHQVFARTAWLKSGWRNNVLFEIENGRFKRIEAEASQPAGAECIQGPVLPAMANVHSHAFQRVMAGMAEVSLNPDDSFWSWRDLMYKTVARLSPDQVRVIATQLYIDMLKAGYTQVGEFHYLHHDKGGSPFANPAEMSLQLIRAAEDSGIGLTLLPGLYSHSGFGAQKPNAGQARFILSTDSYLELQSLCREAISGNSRHRLGICFHSLRAVTEEQIIRVLKEAGAEQVVHIHIAEQQKEVQDCLNWSGERPVEWLNNHIGLDQRWCLVHATHLNEQEIRAVAGSGAVVGLCPTTEANLGDGIFPGVAFEVAGGRWGIGSDSHVSLSIVEELRTLEYSQRLRDRQRNRLYRPGQKSIGDNLFEQALAGGNRACAVTFGLEPGGRADFMVLDETHPFIAAGEGSDILNRWLFACSENLVKDVYVEGIKVIDSGHHKAEESAAREFSSVIRDVIYNS